MRIFRTLKLFILPLTLTCAVVNAPAASEPTARELLSRVRANESGQNRELTGRLQMATPDAQLRIPFRLLMRDGTVIYQFENPPESFVLRLGEKGSRLDRVTGSGKTEKIAGAKLDDLVRGTDISYEDLALKYLYWNNARVLKEDNLGISHCWVVEAVPSAKGDSQYDRVLLWVEKSGGLLKGECYSGGKLIRSFKVTDVQRDHQGEGYILKAMRIERMDAGGKDRQPTYLRVDQN